jgi:hypothetical protein
LAQGELKIFTGAIARRLSARYESMDERRMTDSMNTNELIKKAEEEFASLSKLPVNAVIGLAKRDEGWVVSLEAMERKAIPDTMDMLGLYEVRLDSEGTLLGFERKKLRKRGETQED